MLFRYINWICKDDANSLEQMMRRTDLNVTGFIQMPIDWLTYAEPYVSIASNHRDDQTNAVKRRMS